VCPTRFKTKALNTLNYNYILNIKLCNKMSLKLIVKKLEIRKEKFITREELKSYCKMLKLDYYTVVGYLMTNNYVVRILRGIFYVKSIEERKLKKIDMDHLAVIGEALEIKGIKNWYFGLNTAVKLNNLTHEYFVVDYVINDKIARSELIEIIGYEIKFIKVNKKIFGFGIIKNRLQYSDVEKTVLDIAYLGKYNNLTNNEIKNKLIDIMGYCSKEKIRKYSKHYPKTVKKFIKELTW